MKNILFKCLFILSIFAVGISSCEKKALDVPSFTAGGEGARVRFFNAAFNVNDANGGAMLLNIGANGKLINGNQRVSYGGYFPAGIIGLGYAVIPAGATEYSFNRAVYGIQRTGRTDSIQYTDSVFLKNSFTFENGKFYTIVMTDSLPNLSSIVLEDKFQHFQDTTFRFRLVNLVTKNGTKNDTLELVRRRDKSVLVTGITYGKMSEFKGFSSVVATIDSIYVRKAGTSIDYPGLGGNLFNLGAGKGNNGTILAIGTTSRAASTRISLYFH